MLVPSGDQAGSMKRPVATTCAPDPSSGTTTRRDCIATVMRELSGAHATLPPSVRRPARLVRRSPTQDDALSAGCRIDRHDVAPVERGIGPVAADEHERSRLLVK